MEKLDKIVEISSESKMKTEIDPRSKTSANRAYNAIAVPEEVESHDLSEEKRKQKEELRIQIEKEQEEKIKNQNALIEARAEVKKPVQLGKIDLDQFKKKSKSPVVEEKVDAAPQEEVKAEEVKEEAPAIDSRSD